MPAMGASGGRDGSVVRGAARWVHADATMHRCPSDCAGGRRIETDIAQSGENGKNEEYIIINIYNNL